MITCPACGYLVFDEPPDYEICPVCGWQYDVVDIALGTTTAGPNRIPLVQAQDNFLLYGTADPREPRAREAQWEFRRDPVWRRIDLEIDRFPMDPEVVCVRPYWRPE